MFDFFYRMRLTFLSINASLFSGSLNSSSSPPIKFSVVDCTAIKIGILSIPQERFAKLFWKVLIGSLTQAYVLFNCQYAFDQVRAFRILWHK